MWWLLYLVFMQAAGYGAIHRLRGRLSALEMAGLSACLGPGVFALCLIFLSLLGVRPGRPEVLALGGLAVLVAAQVALTRNTRPAPAAPRRWDDRPHRLWTALCLLAIAYGAVSVGSDAIVYPTMEWDSFVIWQLKGEVLATSALRPRPAYFDNLNLSYSHLRYPVLVPMMSAGLHALTGRLADDGQQAPALLQYLGLLAVVYCAIRASAGHLPAIAVTAMFADLPVFFRYAGCGTAEMALTAFYGCSVVCLLRWWRGRQWPDLILAALFSACMAWTKNEGLALAAINAIVLACLEIPRRRVAAVAWFIGIFAFLFLPWLLYIRGLPRTDEDYAGRLNVHELLVNIQRVPVILRAIGAELLRWSDWRGFWVLLAIVGCAGWRHWREDGIRVLWVLLALHLLVYVPPYMVTTWNLAALMPTTVDRLLMHATPVGAILLGRMWGPLRREL